ncbi:MAG: hypothetical protein WCW47_00070 [Candidatus Paceibacterota bacterium]|jgi:hypothetical protein
MSHPRFQISEAERLVTEKHPTASAHKSDGRKVVHIYIRNDGRPMILGKGLTPQDAWKSVARKLNKKEV